MTIIRYTDTGTNLINSMIGYLLDASIVAGAQTATITASNITGTKGRGMTLAGADQTSPVVDSKFGALASSTSHQLPTINVEAGGIVIFECTNGNGAYDSGVPPTGYTLLRSNASGPSSMSAYKLISSGTTETPAVMTTAGATITRYTMYSFRQVAASSSTALPGVGSTTLAGLAATLAGLERAALPGVGLVTVGGLAPTALKEDAIGPNVGALQALGLQPQLYTERTVAPGVGAITGVGNAPLVLASTATVVPDQNALSITGLIPSLETTLLIDASAHRGHVGTGRRYHGYIGKYEGTESYTVAENVSFSVQPESLFQPLGGAPDFKPLDEFPTGVARPAYVVPPELLAESAKRIARKKRRRAEEEFILKLL